MKRMKSRGKGDSNSAPGDPGRLPRVHQRHVSKREVKCAGRARWRGSPGSVGKGAEEVPGMRLALEATGSLMWVGFFSMGDERERRGWRGVQSPEGAGPHMTDQGAHTYL